MNERARLFCRGMRAPAAATAFSAFLFLALVAAPAGNAGSEEPAKEGDRYVAVTGAHILTVSGKEIPKGTIVVKNGVIEAVGEKVEIPFPAEIIDADGLWVMPGLIDPFTLAGNRTLSRNGVHADLETAGEYDPLDEVIEKILESGFTTLGFAPRGTGIPGRAMAARPLPENCRDRVLNEAAYISMTMDVPSRDKMVLKGAFDKAKKEIEKQKKARKEWEEKRKKAEEEAKKKAEAEKKAGRQEGKPQEKPGPKPGEKRGGKPATGGKGETKKEEEKKKPPEKFVPPPIDPPYAPIADLIRKKEGVRALVAIRRASDYRHLEDALRGYDFEKAFLLVNSSGNSGESDLQIVAADLGARKASVILSPVVNFEPLTRNRVNLAKVFLDAGCRVSFRTIGDSIEEPAAHLRNVAVLIRDGFPREEALAAITLHPAELLGVSGRVGSIEKGKDADLLFLTRDPFDVMARVHGVMMRGRFMECRHEIQ